MERIFLDTRDLIDCVEHNKPCSVQTLAVDLLNRGAVVVLGFTNVSEFVPKSGERAHARRLADKLVQLPHRYIRQATIPIRELKEAFAAYHENRRPNPIDPYVSSWWRSFWRPVRGTTDLIAEPLAAELDRKPLSQQINVFLDDPTFISFKDENAVRSKRLSTEIGIERAHLEGRSRS